MPNVALNRPDATENLDLKNRKQEEENIERKFRARILQIIELKPSRNGRKTVCRIRFRKRRFLVSGYMATYQVEESKLKIGDMVWCCDLGDLIWDGKRWQHYREETDLQTRLN